MQAELAAVQTVPVNGEFKVDGDNVIKTSQRQIDHGHVQFSLSADRRISWWKGIKVFNARGEMVSLLPTQDESRGPVDSPKFPAGNFGDKIKVEIWKAKFLGVHTCVGTVYFSTDECSGHNTNLAWQND